MDPECDPVEVLKVTIDEDGIPNSGDKYLLYVTPTDQIEVPFPSDIGTGAPWGEYSHDIPGLDNYTDVSAARKDFNGEANTNLIADALGEWNASIDYPLGYYAAKVCKELDYGGKGWYLPSLGELEAIFKQLYKDAGGNWYSKNFVNGFTGRGYWSSTELNASYAWYFSFVSEQGYGYPKDDGYMNCRCVRR